MVIEQGLDSEILVDSAGTMGYHTGARADSRMRDHASRRGYELLSRARQLTRQDLFEFDLVIAMDRSNHDDIQLLDDSPTATIRLMSDFLDDQWPIDVPDPYYGGASGFEQVLDMIEAACPKILEFLAQRRV